MKPIFWFRERNFKLNLKLLLSASGADRFHTYSFGADGRFGDRRYKGLSNWIQCHHLVGYAVECDGLEDLPSAHTTGNASRLAPRLPVRAGGKLQGQASSLKRGRLTRIPCKT